MAEYAVTEPLDPATGLVEILVTDAAIPAPGHAVRVHVADPAEMEARCQRVAEEVAQNHAARAALPT